MDSVGGGVVRLDIEVHVLDIVVIVRDTIIEMQREGLGKMDCHAPRCHFYKYPNQPAFHSTSKGNTQPCFWCR